MTDPFANCIIKILNIESLLSFLNIENLEFIFYYYDQSGERLTLAGLWSANTFL